MSMKHSRAEVVKSTVCAYLKRRQYTDSDVALKSDIQLCQTKQQLAILGAVDKEAANQNSISFNSFDVDFNVVDQHFSKLKSWISRLRGPVRNELCGILPPLLFHLTLDILQWNVVLESNPLIVSSAVNFLKKHASSLLMEETFRESVDGLGRGSEKNASDHSCGIKYWRVLEELSNLENCWDICKSKPLLLFRSCKYRLNLTSRAVAILQKYLADYAHLCLIQAIGTWFDVVEVPNSYVVNEEDGEEVDEDEIVVQLWDDEDDATADMPLNHTDISSDSKPTEAEVSSEAVRNGCKEEPRPAVTMQGLPGPSGQDMGGLPTGSKAAAAAADEEEKQMAVLGAAIQAVRDASTPNGPILLYSVQNADDNVVCTNVSSSADVLAAGFGSSEIKLWGLMEGGLPADIREVSAGCGYVCSKDRKRCARLACDIISPSFEADVFGSVVEEEEEEWTALPVVLRGHSGPVQGTVFSGNTLFSCSTDTTLRAWNLTDHTCMAIYRGHTYPVWCVDLCSWGVYVASGSHDRTARLWSPDRIFPLRTYAGHGLDVDCIRFHPNGIYLATGSCDNSVRLWSVTEGKLVRVFPHACKGPASSKAGPNLSPAVTSLAFSPDGKFLASGAEDEKIRVWDLAAGSLLSELTLPASIANEGDVTSNGTLSAEAMSSADHPQGLGAVVGLSWSSEGERLACGFRGGAVAVWQSKQGRWVDFFAALSANPLAPNVSPPDEPRSGASATVASENLVTYSTGMRPLTSLSYVDKRVLVAIGCAPHPPAHLE